MSWLEAFQTAAVSVAALGWIFGMVVNSNPPRDRRRAHIVLHTVAAVAFVAFVASPWVAGVPRNFAVLAAAN